MFDCDADSTEWVLDATVQNEIAFRHVYSELPVIETERLRLRKLQTEDASDMFAYASDPELTRFKFWSTHLSIEDSRTFISQMVAKYRRGQVADWGIEHREEQALIGTIGVQKVLDGYVAGIGHTLSLHYRRQGLALEAMRTITEFGFTHLNLHRIQALTWDQDVESQRLLEAAGMTLEGTLKDYRYRKGRFVTVKMYAVFRQ